MRKLTAIALAAGLALSATTGAFAQDNAASINNGQSMMIGALFNSLTSEGITTDGIEKLTLSEVARLNNLIHSDAERNDKVGQANLILERARERD
ncbi:hypothetical protein [Actibacterium sp. 188UL27-1]|uniref:hypothetical protein n=1 Tax=Actibacterium sp. 188UL27-1 TaxID=2786961 RepID=UPI0019586337|nr:hypothetical protein [Actibacterium sp. 188UL27-1]MBM7070110.1 hypothetical protein [Actibacterium sp. 188UL27-1]